MQSRESRCGVTSLNPPMGVEDVKGKGYTVY